MGVRHCTYIAGGSCVTWGEYTTGLQDFKDGRGFFAYPEALSQFVQDRVYGLIIY